MYMYCQKSYW